MKPPDRLIPLTVINRHFDELHFDLRDRDEKLVADVYLNQAGAEFITFCCNTHESTQAELERLRQELQVNIALLNTAAALLDARLKDLEKLTKERASTIIELRGIADELENSQHANGHAALLVDQHLVALGDLAPGYAKGGEGEG